MHHGILMIFSQRDAICSLYLANEAFKTIRLPPWCSCNTTDLGGSQNKCARKSHASSEPRGAAAASHSSEKTHSGMAFDMNSLLFPLPKKKIDLKETTFICWQDKMDLQDSGYNPHLSQSEMMVRETIYIPDTWVGAVIVRAQILSYTQKKTHAHVHAQYEISVIFLRCPPTPETCTDNKYLLLIFYCHVCMYKHIYTLPCMCIHRRACMIPTCMRIQAYTTRTVF